MDFTGFGVVPTQRNVDGCLLLRERAFLDVPVLAQSPTALLERLRLKRIHAAIPGIQGHAGLLFARLTTSFQGVRRLSLPDGQRSASAIAKYWEKSFCRSIASL